MSSDLFYQKIAVGIFYRRGEVLLGKRAEAEGRFAGFWEFPGGRVEEGETPEEALCREFVEELGVELSRFRCLAVQEFQTSEKIMEIHFFQVKFPEKDCSEYVQEAHSEFRWMSVSEALAESLLPVNQDYIKALLAKGFDEAF